MERIPYGSHPAQFGELTRGGAVGVAVLLHGGFWRARYDLSLMRDVGGDLAGRGWTVWNLEYRRVGDGGGFPATLEDVAAGVDALAELDGGGEGRVVAIGHSAGGQLAAWAATREAPAVRVDAVVAQAGVLDLRLGWELGLSGGAVEQFLGGPPDAVPDRVAAACPRARLPLGVPALVVHGSDDGVVPPRISREFAAAAREAGDDVELRVLDGEEHMGHVEPRSALWQAVTAWL